jgi:hypothetical protein
MASDGEEEVVIEWWEVGELVDKHLRNLGCTVCLASFADSFLYIFWE